MTRMTVAFNDKASAMLGRLQKSTGKSKVEILRTALTLLDYAEEKKGCGEALALVKENKIRQEILIP